jgi:dipeptidyl aminopeptidase/acylaminoacyl peptidase
MKKHCYYYAFFAFFLSFGQVSAQSIDEIAPKDNLIVEGIPKIPASIAETVENYSNFRGASFSSWHPIKREMLISTRFGDATQVHYLKMAGGARQQLTFFKDAPSGASFQTTQGNYFVFSKDVGGGEYFQKFRYDLEDGKVTLLTDGKSRNVGGTWSKSGDKIAYLSTRRNGADLDMYVMHPKEPSTDKMIFTLQGGGWGANDWSADDKTLLVSEYVSINESYIWLFDIEKGEKQKITDYAKPTKISYSNPKFSPDGKGVYVLTDKEGEHKQLAYIDLATKKHTYLTSSIKWDIEEFDISSKKDKIVLASNEEGYSTVYVFDIATNHLAKLNSLPKGVLGGLSWHNNGVDFAFTVSSATSSSEIYSYNVSQNSLEKWTTSEGAIPTTTFATPELIRWKSFDAMQISGFLYRPSQKIAGKRPVIIDIHGGPESQSRPSFLGRDNYFINELGIVLIFPNIRGSDGYGKTFLTLDNGAKRDESYKDIAALIDWIKQQPDLDSERIMITGGSYGGHTTFAVAALYSDKIRCSLPVVGMSNLITFLENTASYRRDLRRAEYGDERDAKMREYLAKIAPMNNAEKIKKPMFIVQGANDPRVPLSEAEQMKETLKKNGTPVWYLVAKDEGHGFRKKPNQEFEFYSTILFVKEYLLK